MELEEAIKYLDMMKNKINFDLEGYVYGNEAIETVLEALENKQKDIENCEQMYDQDEKEICKLHNKICDLEFKLENKDKQIIALNKIIDEEM